MHSVATNSNFPVKPRRQRKFLTNIMILAVMATVHLLLQLQLGSITSGKPITKLPQTTEFSLSILLFLFFGLEITLFLFAGKFGPKLREQTSVFLFILMPTALAGVLVFRVPYSSVFLFWGIILQIILWYLSAWILERVNKPIVGLTAESCPDFKDFISLEFVQIISPNMHDPVELDLIVLKEKELSSPEWSEFLMQCFLNSIVVEEHSNLIEKLSRQVDLGQFSFRKSLQLVRENKYLPIKRAIDISVSMVLLIAFLPVSY